ncbi:hypothetical protein [Chryseobacterium sp. SNU WT5]|uniref:hypothetical protein n=1 Tax=Chryseobacterium sp. SNU WT5 TaxID=2594269 RepID=UPI0016236330|nr:hypothetical protein [Chryseobacterium sp. SNU WT5]
MKKILLGLSVFLMTLVSAQNYPDYYPNSSYGSDQNYSDYDDEFYFPDDYYYEYPSDYYSSDLYRSYYNDYRKSIYNVNWNRFFATYRLSPWQVQEIMMLNESFPSYSAWNSYYRYNPDRWYYDRFYALQRILGPNVFVVFQNNYYRGYNPIVYYQNYNRRHYARNIYVVPRYRNINVNVYRVNRNEYHQSNPRVNIGFTKDQRSRATQSNNNIGFRSEGVVAGSSTGNNGFRKDSSTPTRTEVTTRDNRTRSEVQIPSSNSGFRTGSSRSEPMKPNNSPVRKVETNSGFRNGGNSGTSPQTTNAGKSGFRLTAR